MFSCEIFENIYFEEHANGYLYGLFVSQIKFSKCKAHDIHHVQKPW